MSNARAMSRFALVGGAAAIMVVGTLTGCSSKTEEPSTTITPSSSAPSSSAPVVSPTQKALTPSGENSFSPSINPTMPGGNCKSIVNGVCMR